MFWLGDDTTPKRIGHETVLAPSAAMAGSDCRTYRSGSETITVCSNSDPKRVSTTCRSYRSGSVVKTSCS
jgi:hypothetical protein